MTEKSICFNKSIDFHTNSCGMESLHGTSNLQAHLILKSINRNMGNQEGKKMLDKNALYKQIFTDATLFESNVKTIRYTIGILTIFCECDVLTFDLFRRWITFRPTRWFKQFIQQIYIEWSVHVGACEHDTRSPMHKWFGRQQSVAKMELWLAIREIPE